MPEILIPRRYRRQPTGEKLVPAEDLSHGLIVLQSGRNFVRGLGAPTGTISAEIAPSGRGWRGGTGKYFSSPAAYAPGPGKGWSIAIDLTNREGIDGASIFTFGNVENSGSPRFLIRSIFPDKARLYWNGGYQITSGGWWVSNERAVMVFTHDGTTGRLYINGFLIGSAAVGWDSSEANNWYVGSGFGGQFDAVYTAHAQWSRALSEKEARIISANSSRLFQRPDARVGAFSAATGLTLTSLTMSNPTSSGARATLGITR